MATTNYQLPSQGDIVVSIDESVATVTFNKPRKRNAIDFEGWQTLGKLSAALSTREDVRVVVFTGAGTEAFSSGADISDFDSHRYDSKSAQVYAKSFDGALAAIEAIPQPTLCMIKGVCVGGGCELSLAADIRIAAGNAMFGIPAARLGIVIGYNEMHRLVNLVGIGNANYLLMTGQMIDTSEAVRIGLVSKMLPLSEIDQYVYAVASQIASLAPLSHRVHKSIMGTVKANGDLDDLDLEQQLLPFSNFDSSDFDEGRTAFRDKREPRFRGE